MAATDCFLRPGEEYSSPDGISVYCSVMLSPRHEGDPHIVQIYQQTPTYLQLNIHNNLTLRHYFRYGYA